VPHTARHALPRSHRTALLPGLLILAAAGAFGGMAVLPGAAAAGTASTGAPTALAVRPVAAGVLPQQAHEAALLLAQERRDERASRDRRTAPVPAASPAPPQHVRPGTGRLTSGYGSRWGRLHAGIDLAAGVGAPISAVTAGTVVSAGSEGGYGRAVRVQHDAHTVTLYAHLSELLVTAGQRVTPGTYLGREGSSGNSTGPHLHFEVRIDGVPVDPAPWLRARGVDPAAQ